MSLRLFMPIENSAEKLFRLSKGKSNAAKPAWLMAIFKVAFGRLASVGPVPQVAELVTYGIISVSQVLPPGPWLTFNNK
jgi:hypothetical protein